ncbi:hypothetical protein BKA70DRAFT_1219447 [Coprinopsis sp. MPI-PUGE-AT-0042]|nr:hypothetical protein BKA70DRAFT_1219447 [Coprinopsis sp. MPI-PUGE-AT-0042]
MTEKDRSPHLPSPRTGSPTMADDGHNEIDAASTPWFSPDGLFSIRELLEAPNVRDVVTPRSKRPAILRSSPYLDPSSSKSLPSLARIPLPGDVGIGSGIPPQGQAPHVGGPVPADVIQYGVPDPESLVGVDLKERYISVSGEYVVYLPASVALLANYRRTIVVNASISRGKKRGIFSLSSLGSLCQTVGFKIKRPRDNIPMYVPPADMAPQFSMASGAPASSGPGIAVEPLDDERGHEPLDDERGHEPSDDEHGPDWLHRDRDRAVAVWRP